jgi:hypothetical protein
MLEQERRLGRSAAPKHEPCIAELSERLLQLGIGLARYKSQQLVCKFSANRSADLGYFSCDRPEGIQTC